MFVVFEDTQISRNSLRTSTSGRPAAARRLASAAAATHTERASAATATHTANGPGAGRLGLARLRATYSGHRAWGGKWAAAQPPAATPRHRRGHHEPQTSPGPQVSEVPGHHGPPPSSGCQQPSSSHCDSNVQGCVSAPTSHLWGQGCRRPLLPCSRDI